MELKKRKWKARANVWALAAMVMVILAGLQAVKAGSAQYVYPILPWQFETPTPTNLSLKHVDYADTNTVIAAGTLGVVLRSTNGGQSWAPVNNPALSGGMTLYAVDMISPTSGVAVGESGTAIYTTDGGVTWQAGMTGTPDSLYAVSMVSSTTGFAGGGRGTVLTTTDGGATWTAVAAAGSDTVEALQFLDANTGWALGSASNGSIRRTTDGGANWTLLTSSADLQSADVVFFDANTGILANAFPQILRTTDGGTTWSPVTNISGFMYDCVFAGAATGMCVGNSYAWVTTDAGLTWTDRSGSLSSAQLEGVGTNGIDFMAVGLVPNENRAFIASTANAGAVWTESSTGTGLAATYLNDMSFGSANTGVAVGDSGTILRTGDGGQTWMQIASGVAEGLESVQMLDGQLGYAAGFTDTLLKTTDGGVTWTPLSTGGSQESFRGIDFLDANTGYVGTLFGDLYKTTDGGNTWTLLTVSGNPPRSASAGGSEVTAVQALDANTVYVGRNNNEVFKTTNGGTAWTAMNTGAAGAIVAIEFPTPTTGYVLDNYGGVFKTIDGGNSWSTQSLGVSYPGDMVCVSETECLAGYTGGIAHTVDGGVTWDHTGFPAAGYQNDAAALSIVNSGNRPMRILTNYGAILRKDLGPADATPPSMVANVSVSQGGLLSQSSTVGVSWDAATDLDSGVTGYLVEIYTLGGMTAEADYNTIDLSYSFTGLTLADGDYEVRVTAFNGSDVSSTPGTATFTVDTAPPALPSSLFPVAEGLGSINQVFSWSPPGDAVSQKIEISHLNDFSAVSLSQVLSGGASTLSAPGNSLMLDGGDWYFQVMAFDQAGNSSTASNHFTVDATPPSAPVNLLDEGESTNSLSALSVSWDAGADAESGVPYYSISLQTADGQPVFLDITNSKYVVTACVSRSGCDFNVGQPARTASTIGPASFTLQFTGLQLTNGVNYRFLISSVNGSDVPSDPAMTDGIWAGGAPDTDPPTGGTIGYTDGETTGTSVALALNAGSDPAGLGPNAYVLVMSASYDTGISQCGTYGNLETLTQVASNTSVYEAIGLVPDTCYQFAYSVSDQAGNSALYSSSNVLIVRPPPTSQDTTPPSGGSIIYQDGVFSGSELTLNLNPGADESGLQTMGLIQKATAPYNTDGDTCGEFTEFMAFLETEVANTTLFVESLIPGSCYQFQYQVMDTAGNPAVYTSSAIVKVPVETSTSNPLQLEGNLLTLGMVTPGTFTVPVTTDVSSSQELANIRLLAGPLVNTQTLVRTAKTVGGAEIPASMIVTDPMVIELLSPGTPQPVQLKVMVPAGTLPGVYEGSQMVYADLNGNVVKDEGEPYVMFGLSLMVPDFGELGAVCPTEEEPAEKGGQP